MSTTESRPSHRPRGTIDHQVDEGLDGPLDAQAARRIHASVGPRGRLAVFRPIAAVRDRRRAIQSLVLCLSECGFVLLDEDVPLPPPGDDDGVWVLAQATRFSIRGYTPGDEGAIAPLFQESFHVARDDSVWRWKFEQHPWRDNTLPIALAWDGDQDEARDETRDPRLIGQYAAVPMRIAHAGMGDDRALQLCDIMTAPAARAVGRGPTAVLSRMLRRLYATHGEHRIDYVIGWNTATSRAFALRFHAGHELEPVADWVLEGPPLDHGAGGSPYTVREIESFDAEFDAFFERVLPAYGYLQRRDAAYLTWRYRQPGVDYLRLGAYLGETLVGWSIFRQRDRDGAATMEWGDALVDPRHDDAASTVLQNAIDHPSMQGATQIEGWFSERPSWWHTRLQMLGFQRRPQPDDLSLIYGVHRLPSAGDRLKRLYYTKSDSDLF